MNFLYNYFHIYFIIEVHFYLNKKIYLLNLTFL